MARYSLHGTAVIEDGVNARRHIGMRWKACPHEVLHAAGPAPPRVAPLHHAELVQVLQHHPAHLDGALQPPQPCPYLHSHCSPALPNDLASAEHRAVPILMQQAWACTTQQSQTCLSAKLAAHSACWLEHNCCMTGV